MFTTIGGFTAAQTELTGNGIIPFGTSPYRSPTGEDWINSFLDTQQFARFSALSGVLSGGVCTVSVLTVTIPAGTTYLANGLVWTTDADITQIVTDGSPATTYLWGCGDGEVRVTETSTAPTGFEGNKSCLLVKATANGGTATLDLSVQQKAAIAYPSERFISWNNLGLMPIPKRLPTGIIGIIPDGGQLMMKGGLEIQGTGALLVRGDGELVAL